LTRVLIIDDDVNMTGVLEVALREAGYTVMSTNTGAKGAESILKVNPDVVILDLIMPEMDGWETCQAIRKKSDVPILILSVINKPDLVARALDDGADDYLVKPVPLNVLIAHLNNLTRRAHPDMPVNGVKYGVNKISP
jgi:two-component system response regulator ResD